MAKIRVESDFGYAADFEYSFGESDAFWALLKAVDGLNAEAMKYRPADAPIDPDKGVRE